MNFQKYSLLDEENNSSIHEISGDSRFLDNKSTYKKISRKITPPLVWREKIRLGHWINGNQKKIQKRLGWKRRLGVSEVVANILILAITTTMFAGIIIWAMSFPHPITSKRTEFDTQITLLPGDKADLKITHKSGEALKASDVRIVIAVDNYIITKSLSDSSTWNREMLWTPSTSVNYILNNVKFDSTVSIVILIDDGSSSVIIYKTTVLKGEKNQPPIIVKLFSNPYPILAGNKFSLHAFVWDPDGNLDSNSIFINISSFNASLAMPFNGISIYKMEKIADNHYSTIELSIVQDAPLGIMPVSVNATDLLGLQTVFNTTVTIGQEVQGSTEVDLMIKNTDITVDNMYPLQGEKITIYARMTNIGGRGAESTIVFWDGFNELGRGEIYGGGNTIFIQGNYDTREFYYEWIPTSPGTHTIRAEARVVSSDPLDVDIDITNNFASLNITVFPKILLIDDDNHASDKSREDTVGFMEAALTTLGFKYEVYRIKSGANGPAFSVGDHNLSGYGIVIWMCGYQTSSTLTPSDIENLKLYLNSQLRSLWLIGAGILDDLSPTDGDTTIGSFVESYLRVKSVQHNVGIPNPIVGVPTHWMTSGYQFVTSTSGVPNTADTIVPNTNAEGMFYNETSGQNLSLTYEFPNTGSKLCFQAYPISQLRNLNDIATVAYKVIKWLGGNITIMSGQDVSVSQQEIDNTHPYYMDTIQISGVVRNNRDTPISNVRVRVMLDGITKLNETVIPLLDTGTSQNAYCWVYANWTANSLGLHNIQIIADPLDEIIETDETNNIAPIDFSTTEVFVMYDILIVDDDNSENNGGVNATEYITNAFSRLGYNYSYFLVNETTAWNGPDNETMLSYNLVIWCTGIETTNTLTAEDRQVVARYLNSYGYFWLIGSGWVNDLRTNDVDFLRNVLHVQSETLNLELRRELKGNDNDFTLRGKRFQTEQPTGYEGDIVDSIVPDAQSVGIIYDENNLRCFALKYDNPDPANKAKLMLFSFDLANIMNESFPRELSLISTQSLGNEREELIYLCARWFGIPDSRIELKIEKIDFTYSMPPRIMNRDIEQLIPIVGDTFVLHARVYNVGSSRGDCVVRFVDGDTIINSVTISVGANSSTIAEVIWRPLFAGTRTISVIIDPTSNINTSISPADYTKEIFQHNNVINHTCIVYYFYDDMELGSHNWVHDTTLVNINGEVPLEFLDMYGPVNINVTSSWNTTGTIGLNKTSKIYHSLNNSYYIKEPSPEPKPVDVVLAIDTSLSMVITDNEGEWRYNDVDVSYWAAGCSNLLFRFRLMTSSSGNTAGAYIDDIVVTGNGAVVYSEDFDPSSTGTWSLSSEWEIGQPTYSGGPSADHTPAGVNLLGTDLDDTYSNSADMIARCPSGLIDVSGCTEVHITYYSWMKLGSSTYDNDRCHLEISTDGGTTWKRVYGHARIEQAKYAACMYVASMSSTDRVAIYTFGSGTSEDVLKRLDFTTTDAAGKATAINTILSLDGTSYTPLYDMIGAATNYAIANGRAEAVKAVVAMTDGDDQGNGGSYETGSETYCPGAYPTSGNIKSTWQTSNPSDGCIWNSPARTYSNLYRWKGSWNTYTVSNDESTRTGLLGAPVYVFTIGVGTSPQAYDPASDGYMDPQLRVSDTTGAPTGLDPNAFVYNFTTEYDLKQIAESSGGIYKYAPTSEQLYGIYMEISQLISSLALSQAKSGRGDGNSDNSRGSALDDSMATTETFSLVGYSEATLSFYQKYYMKHGANGIVVQVGINQSGTWKYKYVIPKQLYTGNIWLDAPSSRIKDDFNVEMRWAYNGISGSGKFTWDYVEVDLTPFVGYSEVRVRFRYLNVTSAYGGYWYIDDLKVRATRSDYLPTYLSADQWEYKTADAISGPAHSGTKMWWCHNTSVGSTTDAFRKGIDNSLYSRPIDLTNARNATFEAYFKFNINYSVGRPPDCLRVEVSNDNGLTWRTLTLGVRAAWNVSGTEAAGADGKSYTGLDEGNNWVSSNTLSRLTTDLTGWAGSVIKLRIRVISATDHANYQSSSGNVFGVYVDDVCVYGTSLEGAGRGERAIDNSENEEYVQFNTNMNSTSENIDKPKEEQKKIVSYSTIENEKEESEGIVVLFDNIEYIMRYEEEFVGRDEL